MRTMLATPQESNGTSDRSRSPVQCRFTMILIAVVTLMVTASPARAQCNTTNCSSCFIEITGAWDGSAVTVDVDLWAYNTCAGSSTNPRAVRAYKDLPSVQGGAVYLTVVNYGCDEHSGQYGVPIHRAHTFVPPASWLGSTIYLEGWLVGSQGPPSTGRQFCGDALYLSPVVATVYGTAKSNSCGTQPAIEYSGLPGASASSGFVVTARNAKARKPGMLIYTVAGANSAGIPFHGGLLFLNSPFRRTVLVVDTAGTPGQCDGVLSIDMNAFAAGALGGVPLPALSQPGTLVDCQFWGRDSVSNGSLLSDALEYLVGP